MALFDEAPILWLAASLRHLSFTVPRMTTVDKQESLKRFWKQVVVRRVLQPAVYLESLVITGNGLWSEDEQGFDVSQALFATFPRLAALSLMFVVWGDGTSGVKTI